MATFRDWLPFRFCTNCRRYGLIILASVFLILEAGVRNASAGMTLPDVRGHWAEPEIRLLAAKQIVAGYPDGRFLPDREVNRAEFAKIIATSLGLSGKASDLAGVYSRFKDVPDRHWAKGFIESASDLGIVRGYQDGTFRPEARLSRAEAVVMCLRAIKMRMPPGDQPTAGESRQTANTSEDAQRSARVSTPFSDQQEFPDWAADSILEASKLRLVSGYPDGSFKPFQSVTRAEAARIVAGILEVLGTDCDLEGKALQIRDLSTLEVEVLAIQGSDEKRPPSVTVVNVETEADCFILRDGKKGTLQSIRPGDRVKMILRPGWKAAYIKAYSQAME